MREFLVFIGMAFVVTACNGVGLPKTADPRVISSALGVHTPLLSRLYHHFEYLKFCEILLCTLSGPVCHILPYVVLR